MGKRQRTPHFVTSGIGEGQKGHHHDHLYLHGNVNANVNGDAGIGSDGNGVHVHVPGVGGVEAAATGTTDDIVLLTQHRKNAGNNAGNKNLDNPHQYRLRPTNERKVRMDHEMMDAAAAAANSRWNSAAKVLWTSHASNSGEDGHARAHSHARQSFLLGGQSVHTGSGHGGHGVAPEQWQLSAFTVVGVIVLLSALFLHLVSETNNTTSSSSSNAKANGTSSSHHHHYHHNNHHHNKNKRKCKSSGTTRKKKTDESDEEDSEHHTTTTTTNLLLYNSCDEESDGQASTSTPNNNKSNKPLFYPYQPRHRKPSAGGVKETYANATTSSSSNTNAPPPPPYSPPHVAVAPAQSITTHTHTNTVDTAAASGFHSRNYYLTPNHGPVMMPSYQQQQQQQQHASSPSHQLLKVAAPSLSPQVPKSPIGLKQQQQQQPSSPAQPIMANNTSLLATPLDQEFVATGLETFQADPPPPSMADSNYNSNYLVGTPTTATSTTPQPLSYTHNNNQSYMAYGTVYNSNSNNNNSHGLMEGSTHHISNRLQQQQQQQQHLLQHKPSYHSQQSNNSSHSNYSNIDSIGLPSPLARKRIEMEDITDMETPRAGLTRRTVDVTAVAGISGGTSMAHYRGGNPNPSANANASPMVQRSDYIHNMMNDDPFHILRLPSASSMGMSRPLNSNNNSMSHASQQQPQPQSPLHPVYLDQQGAAAARAAGGTSKMPLLPKLDAAAAQKRNLSSNSNMNNTNNNSIAAPRSISVEELRLVQMESGSAPHWHVRDHSGTTPANNININNNKASSSANAPPPPLGSSNNLFDYVPVSDGGETTTTEEEFVETNEARKSIVHKRSNITDSTDAASSLQSSIKFPELKLVEVIGGGGFGQVWKASWRGTPVAVKVLTGSAQAKHVSKAILEEFAAEINLLSGMRHPNITLYMGACVDPPNRAIITELAANGSLWDALRLPLNAPFTASNGFSRDGWPESLYNPGKHGAPPTFATAPPSLPPCPPPGSWPWALVKHVACGTARGMAYLHSGDPPILHRDMKSANVLLSESYTPKVCDFGLSRLKAQERSMTGNCGTVQWMAPEVLANQSYNEKADVYSYGIICTELLTRECPYEGMSAIQCALAVLNRDQRPEVPRWCPPQLKALIKACVKKNPDERPTFPQIISALDAMP